MFGLAICSKLQFSIEMQVMRIGKRVEEWEAWEPIYIGTNQEPLYDERMSWEGHSDKRVQVILSGGCKIML